uniref:Small ribosomal subunit protein uS10m n=1 Tax=Angiostrongylus cantonensis TaxID=6313 RepID=A0A0K0CWY4_ANGCA
MFTSIFGEVQNAIRPVTLMSSRAVRSVPRSMPSAMTTPSEPPMPDKLYSFHSVCTHLNLTRGRFQVVPYVRWIQPALRSKFVHKKYKLHYETRTHITLFEVRNLTGSTASTFLEYIQRNIPEGVGMRVGYVEIQPLPPTINPAEKIS